MFRNASVSRSRKLLIFYSFLIEMTKAVFDNGIRCSSKKFKLEMVFSEVPTQSKDRNADKLINTNKALVINDLIYINLTDEN